MDGEPYRSKLRHRTRHRSLSLPSLSVRRSRSTRSRNPSSSRVSQHSTMVHGFLGRFRIVPRRRRSLSVPNSLGIVVRVGRREGERQRRSSQLPFLLGSLLPSFSGSNSYQGHFPLGPSSFGTQGRADELPAAAADEGSSRRRDDVEPEVEADACGSYQHELEDSQEGERKET